MLIIEPSRSEWFSPVVLVSKKDDPKLRFSKLNAVSTFDPYPMPRVDELIECLGNVNLLTIVHCKNALSNLRPNCVDISMLALKTSKFGCHNAMQ